MNKRTFKTTVLPFYLESGLCKGRMVRIGDLIPQILNGRTYPPVVLKYMAEMIALTSVLSVDMKHETIFTLQLNAEDGHTGPIKMITVDVNSRGHVRAYVKINSPKGPGEEEYGTLYQPENAGISKVFGNGKLIFTADILGQENRYQSLISLNGKKTLSNCLQSFFEDSEQLPTVLCVHSANGFNQDGTIVDGEIVCGALLLQKLPPKTGTSMASQSEINLEDEETSDDDWNTNQIFLNSLTAEEMLDQKISNEELLFRLFNQSGLHFSDEKTLIAKCSCSFERLQKVIAQLSEEEKTELTVDGKITATCEFCNTHYELK